MTARRRIQIAPSILTADFGRLADAAAAAEQGGADRLHLDVMDGHFVPNITFGASVVQAVRAAVALPIEVHLMIEEPDRHLRYFIEAGAGLVTVHLEASRHLFRTLSSIRDFGARAGVAINPSTPLSALEEVWQEIDLLLVMTINPGFGGQRLIPGMIDKAARAVRLRNQLAPGVEIEVDGGVDPTNAQRLAAAGVDVLVAGSAIYNAAASVGDNLRALRESAERVQC